MLIGISSYPASAMQNSLSDYYVKLQITLDKESYRVGDSIHIRYTLTNLGQEEFRFMPWRRGYDTNWIKIYDLNMKEMEVRLTSIYELSYPGESFLVLLKPDETYSLEITGLLINDTSNTFIEGIRIAFNAAGIHFDSFGKFIVKAQYDGLEIWKALGIKQLKQQADPKHIWTGVDFKNIWTGTIESNEVTISIENN